MACKPQQVYLTHYSRVGDLDRLADDMHTGIDAYERMALDCRDAVDRGDALRSAMYEYLLTRIIEHGFKGGNDAIRSIVQDDVTLNAAGLVAWLERLEKRS